MIIALSAEANSGKDTVADHLCKKHGFVKIAFADPLKRICQQVYAFSDEQLWGPSEMRNAPDSRYPRTDTFIYPAAPVGALWLPIGGGRTLINESDLKLVSEYDWCLNKKETGKRTEYVRTHEGSMKMHQLFLGEPPEGQVIDHINGDGLDNRRTNLRFCTHSENHANERKRRGGTSVFKGVSFDSNRDKWSAKIMVNGETRNLGRFDDESAAAIAYDLAAVEIYGQYARTNSSLFLTPRYALQQLGTNWGRDCYENTWVDLALRTAQQLAEGGCYYDQRSGLRTMSSVEGVMTPKVNVVIPDMRWPGGNEGKAVKAAGGKLVLIDRQGAGLAGAAGQHASETSIVGVPRDTFDWILDNNSDLHVLKLRIDSMMDRFNERIIPYDEAQADVPPFMRKPRI